MTNLSTPIEAGQRFGKLIVIKVSDTKRPWSREDYECLCDCGKTTVASKRQLQNPQNGKQSCGCLYRKLKWPSDKKRQSEEEKRLYVTWWNMKDRCYNPRHIRFDKYGGRGITVCDAWLNNVKIFIHWALNNGYENTLTIERKNVNGNYNPGNCRFVY